MSQHLLPMALGNRIALLCILKARQPRALLGMCAVAVCMMQVLLATGLAKALHSVQERSLRLKTKAFACPPVAL